MSLWTAQEVVTATQGRAHGPAWEACGVSIDSRSVARGDLFVALAGESHDGHDHVGAALAAGAAAALVHRIPEGLEETASLVLVGDTRAALYDLARAARARTEATLVAVTGSVGKTGTKEMLKLALETTGPTHATSGNLNNHWGVPLTLARLPRDARFAVIEIGMNHAGEIAPLAKLARPHVAIVTAVEAVHMEFFASTAEIAAAKAEIFQGVLPGGTAILPRDNRHAAQLVAAAFEAGITRIVTFGQHIDATARLLDCAVEPASTAIFALVGDAAIGYRVGVSGQQWATNSLAVLLAAEAVGIEAGKAAAALAAMTPPKGRGLRKRLAWQDGFLELIDESYNASPASMKAAIMTLASAKPAKGGRRVAVLGDMLELGPGSDAFHASLADSLRQWRTDLLFAAGPHMRHLHDALPPAMQGGHAADSLALAPLVAARLQPGDVVMVKGSAGSRMDRIVKALENQATPGAPPGPGA